MAPKNKLHLFQTLAKNACEFESCRWSHDFINEAKMMIEKINLQHPGRINKKKRTVLASRIKDCYSSKRIEKIPAARALLEELSKHVCNCCFFKLEWLLLLWNKFNTIRKIQNKLYDIEYYWQVTDKKNIKKNLRDFLKKYDNFRKRKKINQQLFMLEVSHILEVIIGFYNAYVREISFCRLAL